MQASLTFVPDMLSRAHHTSHQSVERLYRQLKSWNAEYEALLKAGDRYGAGQLALEALMLFPIKDYGRGIANELKAVTAPAAAGKKESRVGSKSLRLLTEFSKRASRFLSHERSHRELQDRLRVSSILFNPKPLDSIAEIRVMGMYAVQNELMGLMRAPQHIPFLFRQAEQNVFLYGPPGTGKTMLVQQTVLALARGNPDLLYFEPNVGDLKAYAVGESEKNIHRLFDTLQAHAAQGKRVIMFMDEIDGVGGDRQFATASERSIVNAFLVGLDSLRGTGVTVITATNFPHKMDPAFRRRLGKAVYVGCPEKEECVHFLRHQVRNYLATFPTEPKHVYVWQSNTESRLAIDQEITFWPSAQDIRAWAEALYAIAKEKTELLSFADMMSLYRLAIQNMVQTYHNQLLLVNVTLGGSNSAAEGSAAEEGGALTKSFYLIPYKRLPLNTIAPTTLELPEAIRAPNDILSGTTFSRAMSAGASKADEEDGEVGTHFSFVLRGVYNDAEYWEVATLDDQYHYLTVECQCTVYTEDGIPYQEATCGFLHVSVEVTDKDLGPDDTTTKEHFEFVVLINSFPESRTPDGFAECVSAIPKERIFMKHNADDSHLRFEVPQEKGWMGRAWGFIKRAVVGGAREHSSADMNDVDTVLLNKIKMPDDVKNSIDNKSIELYNNLIHANNRSGQHTLIHVISTEDAQQNTKLENAKCARFDGSAAGEVKKGILAGFRATIRKEELDKIKKLKL